MSNSWDDYAGGWDTNEAVVFYCEKAYESLIDSVTLKNLNVLDFGCGTGLLTEKISKCAQSVLAVDPSEKMIAILSGKGLTNVSIMNSELTQNVIDTNKGLHGSFDLIVASSALAFVPNYQQTLKLLNQLLKKGGLLVQWDWLKTTDSSDIGFSKKEVEVSLQQAGYISSSISLPFSIKKGSEKMDVIMVIAHK
ncbi:methyltransferase domain-containing protein [Oceaniserpentilla sp. 4NH20-0058]|uniref:class I SAM-dependent DNA methyltransferase n=1 Tax=Oceaniserpentilla sp. 4NH20-0058 TaxID=3127660 RepID=UPI003103CF2E